MTNIAPLEAILTRPNSFKPVGLEDSRYVSDEQLNRHFIWRVEMWEEKFPLNAKNLAIRAMNLIRAFGAKDLQYIDQDRRWEFLDRLMKLPNRYLT